MEGTDKLACFIAETALDEIPQMAIDTAKRSMLDCIGVALAGSRDRAGQIITELVLELGGNPISTIIAGGFRTSPPLAALANGIIAHTLDYDSVSQQMSHPTVTLLPAVLALGEARAVSGRKVLESYLVGFETWAKIAYALPDHSDKGWHTASTIGSLGAAAAAAHVLGLTPEKIKVALSLAFSQASGSRRQFGTMAKPFHAGNGARNGVVAAMLAERGFSADQTILEGLFGLGDLFGGNREKYSLGEAAKNLGDFFNLTKKGIWIKPYPCLATLHSSIEAVLYLTDRYNISPEEVETVECKINKRIDIGYSDVKTPLEGKFSLPFCVAIALKERKVGLAEFTEEKVLDPRIQALMRRVKVEFAPDLIEGEGKVGSDTASEVILKIKNGTCHTYRVNKAKGTPEVPLSRDELISKYKECAHLVLSEKKTEKSIQLLENLEDVVDIVELMRVIV